MACARMERPTTAVLCCAVQLAVHGILRESDDWLLRRVCMRAYARAQILQPHAVTQTWQEKGSVLPPLLSPHGLPWDLRVSYANHLGCRVAMHGYAWMPAWLCPADHRPRVRVLAHHPAQHGLCLPHPRLQSLHPHRPPSQPLPHVQPLPLPGVAGRVRGDNARSAAAAAAAA